MNRLWQRGHVIFVVGLPNHGKTFFADALTRFAPRDGRIVVAHDPKMELCEYDDWTIAADARIEKRSDSPWRIALTRADPESAAALAVALAPSVLVLDEADMLRGHGYPHCATPGTSDADGGKDKCLLSECIRYRQTDVRVLALAKRPQSVHPDLRELPGGCLVSFHAVGDDTLQWMRRVCGADYADAVQLLCDPGPCPPRGPDDPGHRYLVWPPDPAENADVGDEPTKEAQELEQNPPVGSVNEGTQNPAESSELTGEKTEEIPATELGPLVAMTTPQKGGAE